MRLGTLEQAAETSGSRQQALNLLATFAGESGRFQLLLQALNLWLKARTGDESDVSVPNSNRFPTSRCSTVPGLGSLDAFGRVALPKVRGLSCAAATCGHHMGLSARGGSTNPSAWASAESSSWSPALGACVSSAPSIALARRSAICAQCYARY